MLANEAIERLLTETADLMEIAAEDAFRIRSYRNAARAIAEHPEPVLVILADPERNVTDIAGIGKGMAAVLKEIAERGSFERRDEMLERYPPTALEMLKIQGLGPKTIALIFEHFRVTTIDDLERLCLEQKLRTLPRAGAKLEEKVLKSIAQYRRSSGRFLSSLAAETSEQLITLLQSLPGVDEVQAAGSFRRGKETIGDLDLLITGEGAAAALQQVAQWNRVTEVLAAGETKVSVRVGAEGLQVDVRAVPAISLGAALQYFTGSKEHNVALRTRAVRKGLSLNEYALTETATGAVLPCPREEDVYERLGLPWIPPEMREASGEIEAAERNELPSLLKDEELRGDLHMHTIESDGRDTLLGMADAAAKLGHEYIAITDHSKALAMANGLDEKRVLAFAKQIEAFNREGHPVKVLAGIECDILKDGRMDLDDEALAALDYVIASVHSHMDLAADAMTARLLRAMENKHVQALGHPTGRVLLHRDAYQYDFDVVVADAVKRGVWLEINASPERLDLHGPLIRSAKAKGARFVISTDAHHHRHLNNLRFGARMARRGWLTKADVVNTRSLPEFRKLMRGA
jgi:DNA polymerase (family X)